MQVCNYGLWLFCEIQGYFLNPFESSNHVLICDGIEPEHSTLSYHCLISSRTKPKWEGEDTGVEDGGNREIFKIHFTLTSRPRLLW